MSDQRARETKRSNSTDPLIHDANRFLVSAVKSAWHLGRFVVGVAIRIPVWFVRANRHLTEKRTDKDGRRG